MKIILDAMGGDNAPQAPVLGALEAAKLYGCQIALVGQGEKILAAMRENGVADLPQGIEIVHAEDVVDMHDDPARVIHKRKDSSMVVGLKMLAEGGYRFEKCQPVDMFCYAGGVENVVSMVLEQ